MKTYQIDREYLREANTVLSNGQETRTSRIVGKISDEKIGDLNLIVETNEKGIPRRKVNRDTIPIGFAKLGINETMATVIAGEFKGKSYHWNCREYKPKIDLSDVTIKLYKHAKIFKKALNSIQNTPLGNEIFQLDGIKGKKQLTLDEFENTVNNLRTGDSYEQALFIMLRNRLIEEGIMPIDKTGTPYDLSAIHIPVFDVNAYLRAKRKENPKELHWLLSYYELNKHDPNAADNAEEFAKTIHQLREDAPAKYAAIYEYLVEHKYITPTITDLNLTPEQLEFIHAFHNAGKYETLTMNGMRITEHTDKWLTAIFTYLNYKFKRLIKERVGEEEAAKFDIMNKKPAWLAKHSTLINRHISKLRTGDWGDREIYQNFCGLVRDLNNTIMMEPAPKKPSYPKRRKTMFDTARKHSKVTLESRIEN